MFVVVVVVVVVDQLNRPLQPSQYNVTSRALACL